MIFGYRGSMKNYASPHTHIQSIDSASTPEAFVEREKELGTGVITCTDHGYMGACSEVYELAKKNKLIPILGVEGYFRDDDCPILTKAGIQKTLTKSHDDKLKLTFAEYNKYYHITLHAHTQDAYETLVRYLSKADFVSETHGSESKPLFNWSDLEELGKADITVMTGCLVGMVQRHLHGENPRPDIAVAYYERLRALTRPGNFYVEIFPHRCHKNYVSGVFLTLEGGEKLSFWKGKKFKTENVEEATGEELAKLVSKGIALGKLLAIKDRNSWVEREPKQIVSVTVLDDFVTNECTVFAPNGDIQLGANKFMLELANKHGDPVVVSDDAHFAIPEDKMIQDSRLGGVNGTWKFFNSYHRQSALESFAYFKAWMGVDEKTFEGWTDNNAKWADSFKDFKFVDRKQLPTKFYPSDTLAHLKALIDKHGRMDWNNEAWVNRLQGEINLLYNNGTIDLLPYFFLAEEVCYHYETLGLLTGPGRGSAAGLLTTYLLGITHVRPLQYNLSQDRFLTLDRIQSGNFPDIDMDFPDRDPLINPETGWLFKRFGDHVAAISTNTMLRLKSSIKDVARSKRGFVPPEIEDICGKLPNPPQGVEDIDFIFGYTGDDGKEVKGLLEESKELQEYTQTYPDEWELVKKMLGICRGKSRHASAFVICNEPISNFIPLTTISGYRTTQYTAPSVEARGGLKMDFLGLNSLNDIGRAIKTVQLQNGGLITGNHFLNGKRVPGFRIVPFNGQLYDVWDLFNDQEVFRDISESNTETVFQLNTNSAKQWLKLFNHWKSESEHRKSIDSIDAISAFTALDRPGPLDAQVTDAAGKSHNMLVEFANRARGLTKVGNIEFLDKMFPETYGVIVYQEQVEKLYKEITGCSGGEAVKFRKNIAKKEMEKVKKAYPLFIERASQTVGKEQAQAVWDQIVTFAQYGFNKSHSVCYSYVAYACAFLKHHFPVEWWAAVLTNADKKEVAEKFWKHSKQWINLPDIRYSGQYWEIIDGRIQAPLGLLAGVGEKAHNELCEGRPYKTIDDLTNWIAKIKESRKTVNPETGKVRKGTTALHRGVITKLIVSGVADSLFENPTETTILDKLTAYEESLAKALGQKKGKKIDPKILNLNAITLFQYKKQILPVYYQDLLPTLHQIKTHGIVSEPGKNTSFKYAPVDGTVVSDLLIQKGSVGKQPLGVLPMVNGEQLKYLNEDIEIYDGQLVSCAAAGFVVSERPFSYKGKGAKKGKILHAVEVVVDIDSEQFKFVKWPPKDGNKAVIPTGLTGSIVIILVSRYKSDRPFALDAIQVVAPPLDNDKDKEDGE